MKATRVAVIALAVLVTVPAQLPARCAGEGEEKPLRPGTVELGVCGLLSTVDGAVEARFGLRGGTFFKASSGLWGAEAEAAYATVRSLHQVDLEASFSWGSQVGTQGLWPFIAIGAGLRLEALGSFRQTLIPVGATLGVRMLATESAGIRLDVKVRRVLNDPVKDFTEINLALGISFFLQP